MTHRVGPIPSTATEVLVAVRRPGLAWALLGLALAVRVAAVLATPDYQLVDDPADYGRHARSIADGDGYPDTTVAPAGGPTALRPPVYPHLLGAAFWLFGDSLTAARLGQAVLGTVTVGLIGLVARQLWDRRVGLTALGLAALYPPLVIWSTAVISEVVFLPLVLASVAAALEWRRERQPRWLVVSGVAAGLAILARANGAVLLLPLAAAAWTVRPRWSPASLSRPAALLAAAVLTVAPWTVRNAVVMDAFVPVSTQAGFALSGIYNDTTRRASLYPGAFRPPALDPEVAAILGRDLDEAALERELRAFERRYAFDHPLYVAEVGARNALRMTHIHERSYGENLDDIGIGRGPALAGAYGFQLVAVLALFGAFTSGARRAPLWFWSIPVLFMSSAFVGAFIRYRAPVDPFLLMLAALAVTSGADRVRRSRPRSGLRSPA